MGPLGDLFDSTALIDSLNGLEIARTIIKQSYRPAISTITWIEVMAGTESDGTLERALLDEFKIIPLTPEIAERTAVLRRSTRLKLPDALIYATAQVTGRILVTRNSRDFRPGADVRIPYSL